MIHAGSGIVGWIIPDRDGPAGIEASTVGICAARCCIRRNLLHRETRLNFRGSCMQPHGSVIVWLSDTVQEIRDRCRRRTPLLKVVAAEPERTSTRSSIEICLAPPEMAEQHACWAAWSFRVQVRCHQQRLEQIMAENTDSNARRPHRSEVVQQSRVLRNGLPASSRKARGAERTRGIRPPILRSGRQQRGPRQYGTWEILQVKQHGAAHSRSRACSRNSLAIWRTTSIRA